MQTWDQYTVFHMIPEGLQERPLSIITGHVFQTQQQDHEEVKAAKKFVQRLGHT